VHKASFKEIQKDDVVSLARDMKSKGCPLVVITGNADKEGNPIVSYSYDVNGAVETFSVKDQKFIPSITGIYGTAAEWFEEEIAELMDVGFDGLDKKGRLFLPEEFDGSGQILVSPLSELVKNKD
jgi:Ni,Fe-hydrogenase III component G